MSPWYSVGCGWSEAYDSRNGLRRGLEGAFRGRMVLADVQCWELVVSNGVEWGLQAVQFEFESVEMERGGTGRRFDRPCSDPDSDGHTVGYPVTNGVNVGAHELFTQKENCDAEQASFASDGRTRESCWEACRWITVELSGQLATFGVDWWCWASNGVDGWMAFNGATRMAWSGTRGH